MQHVSSKSLVLILLGASTAVTGCPTPPTPTDAPIASDVRASGDTPTPLVLDAFAPPDAFREGPPVLYNESPLNDMALATQALAALGYGTTPPADRSCSECHSITRRRMRAWSVEAQRLRADCLPDSAAASDTAAAEAVACIHANDVHRASNVGIFASGATNAFFSEVFNRGAGATAAAQRADFLERAAMPMQDRPALTQAQYDIVATWFMRGVPALDTVVPPDTRPRDCTPFISPEVITHVESMRTTGWTARNREAGILMHGCAGAASPLGCFATTTRARDTTYGANWDIDATSNLRVLFTVPFSSSYWTRSSVDGRYFALGGGRGSSHTVDLQTGVTMTINNASYDPGFFPDNSAFVWPGRVCEQSLLATNATITLREAQCSNVDFGLYEHVGVGLAGGDYWIVNGEFENDDGGHRLQTEDVPLDFSAVSSQTFTRILNTGAGFTAAGSDAARTPYGGDAVITPSSTHVMTRVGGAATGPVGYSFYRINATTSPSLSVTLDEVASYCTPGNKPGFSLDERYMAIHHYIGADDAVSLGFTGPDDPGFAPYRLFGASNIYLIDLTTGISRRVTNMGPGQYALFPHFRSDGWMYFLVRQGGRASGEYIVASDAALR